MLRFPLILLILMTMSSSHAKEQVLYIGTYTPKSSDSRGIYALRLNTDTGALTEPTLAAETPNPTFLELHPRLPVLYAVSESRNGDKTEGAVRAFAIEAEKLQPLNLESTGGDGLCHVNIDGSGRVVVGVSYGGGEVASFPVRDDGTLGPRASVLKTTGKTGPNTQRQEKPHPHSATFSPDNRFVYVCDLGLDLVFCYAVEAANGSLKPAGQFATEPGAGPRHSKFSADGNFFYVINELGNTVSMFTVDQNSGALQRVESVPSMNAAAANSITAEIRVHPSGKFTYGSNRGHDSIAAFQREESTGRLRLIETVSSGGKHPRNFALSPDGRWLVCANRDSDNLVVFRIDPETGRLTATGHTARVPQAVCVLFAK